MKRRVLSVILILSMLSGVCPVGALAAGGTTAATGELRLTIHRSDEGHTSGVTRVAGAWAETDFTVTLTGTDGARKEVLHAGTGELESSLTFKEIADGVYTLTVAAPNYLTYTQELQLDARNCVHVDLFNYAHKNAGRDANTDKLYGVIPVGDVNADGKIDDADADLITAAIGSSDLKYDLSGDGVVDLIDLALAVRNQSGVVLATPETYASSAVVTKAYEVAIDEDTDVALNDGGALSDLLDQSKQDTVVTLKPATGEAISKNSPVELSLTTVAGSGDGEEAAPQVEAEALVIAAPSGSKSTIAAGTVDVLVMDVESKEEFTIRAQIGDQDDPSDQPRTVALANSLTVIPDAPVPKDDAPATSAKGVSVESNGTVVIDLGQRVAIKKVTIRVTASADRENPNLVEIAKVEFLSDFADRIPEPQLSIPTVLSVTNTESDGLGYKSLTVTWNRQDNVTGYEVKVSGPGYNKTATTDQTSYTFVGDSFNGTVKAFQDYAVTVRSVSGDWKSNWSEPHVHTVTCAKVPPAPEYVTATPGVNSLKVTWTCKYDAESFTLYYKHPNDANFTAVEGLTASSYLLEHLQAGVKYTLYVVAHNRNGSSPKSINAEGIPTSPSGVQMSKYKLINVDDAQGKATTHIASITGNADKVTIFGGNDWTVLVDNDPASYITINDWDSGVSYNNFRGPEITLDGTYTFDTVRFAPFEGETVSVYGAAISYYNGSGSLVKVDASLSAKQDAQGRKYYEVMTAQPITASKFQLRTRTFNTAPITMSEVRVYEYDDLENTVAALFADSMRTELKESVTMEAITALITRTETTVDPVSGEAHPHKTTILTDLEYAKALLEHNANAHVITVDNQITASGSQSAAFAQPLSDYQPLGVVAAAGDTVVIYVSDGETARGNNVPLKLVATQYHPQVSAWQSSAIQLKAGRNEITIPKIGSDASERGGSLYLQYTGAKGAKNITVRATGGAYIPVLNVDGVTGAERTAAIEAYVKELRDYAARVEALHGQLHGADKENVNVRYDYSAQNCFLNATEICLENMMYSLPATQVWAAINAGGDPAGNLEKSIAAMEQMIDYFYQFKGLHKDATGADAYPYTRLNIRYHKMFTGAFMYAGGKHIGIEYGSTSAVFALNSIVADENGKYISGNLAAWGVAHEIGHCINAPGFQRVEVTNNVFAQLAKTGNGIEESTANFRTTYPNVYKAVATGTTGHTGNLAVQLAMYWQLHLAYDDNYAYKLYGSAEEAQAAVFYARLEAYLRDKSKAPHAFTASSGDQLFMQAACAAANADVLDFFKAWGFTPDAATKTYAANFAKEGRKIQYIDDDSRLYRLEGKPGMSAGTAVTASITNAVSSRINGNKVEITLSNNNTNPDAMLGYEISRNGKMVAFVPAGETSYTDVVTTENNKAFTYTVTGIDRLLNETGTVALPQVKVCHDGAISKDGWSVQTNMTSKTDTVVDKDENDPESGMVNGNTTPAQEKISAITAALDNDDNTIYTGVASGNNNRPYILLDLGGVEQVTAIKFTPVKQSYSGDPADLYDVKDNELYMYRLFGYKIEISLDGETWTTVKEGNAFTGTVTNPNSWVAADDVVRDNTGYDTPYTLYFNKQGDNGEMDPYMYTYDAAYVRVTSTNTSRLALAEIDVLGPTSDNVELIGEGFGRLSADYSYGSGPEDVIPAGSIVFYGEYKGDPAYNVVLLKDQNGKVLDGSQIILAQVSGSGALGATGDGRWLFWLENKEKEDGLGDHYNEMDQMNGLESVQVELYRVQDAETLAGQRLTSTSLTMTIPETIPNVSITSSASLVAYAPSAAAVAAVVAAGKADRAAAELADPYQWAAVLADTGAAEGDAAAPVKLTSDGATITAQFRPANVTKVAIQAELVLDPATAVTVQPSTNRADIYESHKYDSATGKLLLIAVARQNGLGEGTLSAKLTPAQNCTVTMTGLKGLSNLFELEDREVPQVSVELSSTTPGGSDPGDSDSDSGSSGGGAAATTPKPTTTPGTKPTREPLPFADVPAGSWYEDAVRYVYEKGMMQGVSEGGFAPDMTTSRAMLVTVLYRLAGSPAAGDQTAFADVPSDMWYAAAVSWASANGIVNGYDAEHFAPDNSITREQMATILYRYSQSVGMDMTARGDLSAFTDVSAISEYAGEAMAWAVGYGLISGMGDGTVNPAGNATRAQVATILMRYLVKDATTAK